MRYYFRVLILILVVFFANNAPAAVNYTWEDQYLISKNITPNPGFENGRTGWTVSGGAMALTQTTAQVARGQNALSWDPSAAAQTLSSTLTVMPSGLFDSNCLARIVYTGGSTGYTFSVNDGSTDIASKLLTAQTVLATDFLHFKCPTSGSLKLKLTAAANEPIIYIDDTYLGYSYLESGLVGVSYFAQTANCNWQRGASTFGLFATDTDCPGPTVFTNPGPGIIQTTDANLPRVTINDLPAGTYSVDVNTNLAHNSGGAVICIAVSNDAGSTSNGRGCTKPADTNSKFLNASAIFTYTTSGNRQFDLVAAAESGIATLDNDVALRETWITFKRYSR